LLDHPAVRRAVRTVAHRAGRPQPAAASSRTPLTANSTQHARPRPDEQGGLRPVRCWPCCRCCCCCCSCSCSCSATSSRA